MGEVIDSTDEHGRDVLGNQVGHERPALPRSGRGDFSTEPGDSPTIGQRLDDPRCCRVSVVRRCVRRSCRGLDRWHESDPTVCPDPDNVDPGRASSGSTWVAPRAASLTGCPQFAEAELAVRRLPALRPPTPRREAWSSAAQRTAGFPGPKPDSPKAASSELLDVPRRPALARSVKGVIAVVPHPASGRSEDQNRWWQRGQAAAIAARNRTCWLPSTQLIL